MRKTLMAALAAAALFTAAACGNDNGYSTGDGYGPDPSAEHNAADVTFAQQMIPHHEQAIVMAELAESRAESRDVRSLATAIEAAQGPEIAIMTGWLESWGEDVPDSIMGGNDHGAMDHGDMPGMMSEEQMATLEDASGAEFDELFLRMMIEHHEGAIEMAQIEQADGAYPAAIAMAEEIEATQAEEIELMEGLLEY
jgi:uncharacterized protein (DUF305 family)